MKFNLSRIIMLSLLSVNSLKEASLNLQYFSKTMLKLDILVSSVVKYNLLVFLTFLTTL